MSLINEKIVKQVNHYFSNENLSHDRFFQREMNKDHGWVKIDFLLGCNALKRITQNKATIAAALKDSDLVEVSDDGEKIRRNPEIPLPDNMPQFWQDLKKRTRGFPRNTSNDEIMQFLNSYGEVVDLIKQKHKRAREFRGCVFVTFKDEATAQNFICNPDTNRFRQAELVKNMVNDCKEGFFLN
uniref:HTH La-type RNA-binding domain-containing protein n=1 Tax=Panagrolaimus davidi TaxID=227884 RepID=A0A914PXD7_9BILA